MDSDINYSIIIPIYNEEEVIEAMYSRLKNVMESTSESYEMLFINDGSRDRSMEMLRTIIDHDKTVKLVNFSRNFGHQIAISAGMDLAAGQAIVIIDADLQDPPEVIPQMIEKWKAGYEVVYATRQQRQGETWFKKKSAALFYRLLSSLTDVKIPVDTGDFRLMDRKVCNAMKSIREKNRFVRGLVSWVGFRQASIVYNRDERYAGVTKYPLRKMLKLSVDAITNFSYKPLKIASYLGFVLSTVSFIYIFYAVYQKLFTANTESGWTSIVAISLFFNGIILIILGIIGEYIGRIYDETKDRPLYIISTRVGFDDKETDAVRVL